MWARVTRFSLAGEGDITDDEVRLELQRADEAVRRNVADNNPGRQGYQCMVDRATRRTLALTYRQSRDDIRTNEPQGGVTQQVGLPPLKIESIDRLEIVAAYGPGYR